MPKYYVENASPGNVCSHWGRLQIPDFILQTPHPNYHLLAQPCVHFSNLPPHSWKALCTKLFHNPDHFVWFVLSAPSHMAPETGSLEPKLNPRVVKIPVCGNESKMRWNPFLFVVEITGNSGGDEVFGFSLSHLELQKVYFLWVHLIHPSFHFCPPAVWLLPLVT